jgi:hypothetical protein
VSPEGAGRQALQGNTCYESISLLVPGRSQMVVGTECYFKDPKVMQFPVLSACMIYACLQLGMAPGGYACFIVD